MSVTSECAHLPAGSVRALAADASAGLRGRTSTVVVGLGNEIAGDDAVGILAARRIERLLAGRSGPALAEVVELSWAGLRLLPVLRGYRRGILIDSLRGGRWPTGSVVRLSESDFAGALRLNGFHDVDYPTALALGRAMGWPMPGRIDVYAVAGESFDQFGTHLTPAVARGLDEVVDLVLGLLGTGQGASP
jgi:hydrogenase maturation protease